MTVNVSLPVRSTAAVSDLSIREYYAAHAPEVPQPWFTVTFDTPEPLPPGRDIDLSAFKLDDFGVKYVTKLVADWRRDPSFDLPDVQSDNNELQKLIELTRPALVDYETRVTQHLSDLAVWQQQRLVAHYAQWPWAWADLILGDGGAR